MVSTLSLAVLLEVFKPAGRWNFSTCLANLMLALRCLMLQPYSSVWICGSSSSSSILSCMQASQVSRASSSKACCIDHVMFAFKFSMSHSACSRRSLHLPHAILSTAKRMSRLRPLQPQLRSLSSALPPQLRSTTAAHRNARPAFPLPFILA